MRWRTVVLVLALVMAISGAVYALQPKTIDLSEVTEPGKVFYNSVSIPYKGNLPLNGFAVSGAWEGSGFAQVILKTESKQYLVFDTRSIPQTIEFSDVGTQFYAACKETCSLQSTMPIEFEIKLTGPGILRIEKYHLRYAESPTGAAVCPQCKVISQIQTRDHSVLAMFLLLVISLLGTHVLHHFNPNNTVRKMLSIGFIGSVIAIAGVFSVAMASPTAEVTLVVKQSASVFSALCIVGLLIISAVEIKVRSRGEPPLTESKVWSELEEAEEQWKK